MKLKIKFNHTFLFIFYLFTGVLFSQENLQTKEYPSQNTKNKFDNALMFDIDEPDNSFENIQNIKSILDNPNEQIKDPHRALFISKILLDRYVRLNIEYQNIERRKKRILDEIAPQKEKEKTSPFPQNIKIKNDIEKLNAQLHQIIEEGKIYEKEAIKIFTFFYNNAELLKTNILKEQKDNDSKINSFKFKTGRHIERLKSENEKNQQILLIISKLKEYPDYSSIKSPFSIIDRPSNLMISERKTEITVRIENRLNLLERELEFLKIRMLEIQNQIDDLREILAK